MRQRTVGSVVMIGCILSMLMVWGCDEPHGERNRRTSFRIPAFEKRYELDPIQNYLEVGVHAQHLAEHQVYIITTMPDDYRMIVALDATCPHCTDTLVHDDLSNTFECIRQNHRFSIEGLPRGVPVDEFTSSTDDDKGMVRFRISNEDGKLTINKAHQYLFENNDWSMSSSMLLIEQDEYDQLMESDGK